MGYPDSVSELIDAAHGLGMKVVAWYLPGLRELRLDRARSLAAIRFSSLAGGRFDSFALDIESTKVGSVWRRNLALLSLSRSLRRAVGRAYPLGAIVPDERSTTRSPGLWPGFPYAAVARLYDVYLPMSYSTNRARGARAVYRYTYSNVAAIRTLSWPRRPPIHVIAGVADRLRSSEARAAARAARDAGAIGLSFYKFTLSGREEWRRWRSSARPARAPRRAGALPTPPAEEGNSAHWGLQRLFRPRGRASRVRRHARVRPHICVGGAARDRHVGSLPLRMAVARPGWHRP